MLDILAALQGVAQVLKDAGVRASEDPQNLNPPCAWVSTSKYEVEYLCGEGTLTVDIFLIAINNGVPQAIKSLQSMLTKTLTVIQPEGVVSLAESVSLASGGDALPAYKITITVPVQDPDSI
ncbi:hypothetical protein [Rhodococcus sp. ANT_H53B]|uniref:hypothetical protein n=1 Tax=Rhodococcus sp. ANT_H53B TaxID=2597357 RepID=UPI0011EC65FC|nr:hypothetical protein [Rhodococcus sp. ANT_H53B]KAA0925958.1 hypothetical protein FQ188_10410 [Rhodococcus sp. ANT_H53B]